MVSDLGQRPPCPFRVTSWPVGLVICLSEFPSGNKAEMLVGWTVGVMVLEGWKGGVGEMVLGRRLCRGFMSSTVQCSAVLTLMESCHLSGLEYETKEIIYNKKLRCMGE